MCGIVGIINKTSRLSGRSVSDMADAIKHRGPDGWGYAALNPGKSDSMMTLEAPAASAKVFLGHRRLSIIDVEGSKQPLSNEDGSVWITFNGEIYNYRELADDLRRKGHTLKEKGDTEVLVHLWEEYGRNMTGYLTGMFAFAIYDTKQDVLFLARDRFGEKPLFYWHSEDTFAFASELQAFWRLENFTHNVNVSAIGQFFKYCYIPSPDTVYKNVFSLQPGCCAEFRNSMLSVKHYWKPSVCGEDAAVDMEELQEKFDKAVSLRMIADVPLGLFLSGGIDSSLIAASMAKQSALPVKTFTASTGESWCDESETAALVASHLNTEHRKFLIKPDFVEVSEMLAKHYGQPYADYSSIPTYYISRETRKHVKVALGGDGGDELFAGYDRYANLKLSRAAGTFPYFLRKNAAVLLKSFLPKSVFSPYLFDFACVAGDARQRGEEYSPLFHQYWRDKCFQNDFLPEMNDAGNADFFRFAGYYDEALSVDPLERWLEADQRMHLCDDILTKVDIASMSVSLECRAPFLDHSFAEYANRLSISSKLQGRYTKAVLRQLAGKRLPHQIINLPKKGFTLPLGDWFRKELKEWGHSMIFDNTNIWSSYLKSASVKKMWAEHQTGKMEHCMRLWMIISLILWDKQSHVNPREGL
ncbi:MAG: asparagine synthase (glutamine-hydrolyzing) [Lentisphaerae bacterium GWF2_45_14]|nr:MAG: asparagine synthase (glutamine-hydrolyzing) [Lentisphaerae bacterium GWF2_45_14]